MQTKLVKKAAEAATRIAMTRLGPRVLPMSELVIHYCRFSMQFSYVHLDGTSSKLQRDTLPCRLFLSIWNPAFLLQLLLGGLLGHTNVRADKLGHVHGHAKGLMEHNSLGALGLMQVKAARDRDYIPDFTKGIHHLALHTAAKFAVQGVADSLRFPPEACQPCLEVCSEDRTNTSMTFVL